MATLKDRLKKLSEFFREYEFKIILFIGFLLVASLAFEAGYLQGKAAKERPLIIENTSQCPKIDPQEGKEPIRTSNGINPKTDQNSSNSSEKAKNCAFVGSKNSNKYHLPTCQWAKRIKPENLVCFSSVEDAKDRGYQPDKNCIKQ